jgi:hypothetical protein
MKEEVHIKHSKLFSSAGNYNLNLLNHPDLVPNPLTQIPFDVLTKFKTSKFNLSKLPSVDKLAWLLNANDIIDFNLTYPIIETLHETYYLKQAIDAEVNGKELIVTIKSLESSLGILFKDHNYTHYLHFNTSTNPLKTPVLIQTNDLIKNIDNNSYNEHDFFFSVPFINSLINYKKSKEINLSFVTINLNGGDKTVGIKATFGDSKSVAKYYDISYNPPKKTTKTESESGKGSPLKNNHIFF